MSNIELAFHFSRRDIPERLTLIEGALATTSPSDHATRAALHTALAAHLIVADPRHVIESIGNAQHEAILSGDDIAHAYALVAECFGDLTSSGVEQRRANAERALAIALASDVHPLADVAFFLVLSALAELGDLAALDRMLSGEHELMTRHPALVHSRYAAWFRCFRATLDGQAERAEQLAHEAHALAQRDEDPDAAGVLVGQLAIVRWMQGRVAELEPAFLDRKQVYPNEPIWSVTLAWMWIAQGRRSAARALIDSLPTVDQILRDRNWLATICILAVVASELGEKTIAADARRILLPFEDHIVTIGLGVTCWGIVARPLALTAKLLGDIDAAIAHYRRAVEISARTGAHAWLAEAQWELAALLLAHPDGDNNEAQALATEAASAGRALQLHGVEAAAARILSAVRDRDNRAPLAPLQPASAHIRILGGFEVTSASGKTAQWQSRKARDLLKILIARRGVAIPRESAMDLLWPDAAPDAVANRFAVACTAVRRALDPERALPSDAYLSTQDGLVKLRTERLSIDAEIFLAEADAALREDTTPEAGIEALTRVMASHRGDALIDEPYALWAERIRRDVQVSYFACAYRLAELAERIDDQFTRVEAFRSILAHDEYDQRAHLGLIDALERLGSTGQAARASAQYAERMAELGIEVD